MYVTKREGHLLRSNIYLYSFFFLLFQQFDIDSKQHNVFVLPLKHHKAFSKLLSISNKVVSLRETLKI
jgi:hypothetical protein